MAMFPPSPWSTSPGLLAAVCLVSVLVLVDGIRRFQRWRRLRDIPGPFLAGLTSLWLTSRFIRGRVYSDWRDLMERYGPVVRIGPNDVLVTDPDALYEMTSVRSKYTKSDWYQVGRITPNAQSVLTITDRERRKERRKMVMPAYTGKVSGSFDRGIDQALAAWTGLIERRYVGTGVDFRPLDLARAAHFYAIDSLGFLAYSRPLGYLAHDRDMNRAIEITERTLPFMMVLSEYPAVNKLVYRWPLSYLLPREGDKAGFGAIIGFTTKLIDERLRQLSSSDSAKASRYQDMLQSLIDSGLQRAELIEEVALQFFVGTDTIANAVRLTLYLLITNPACYAKLQAELDAHLPALVAKEEEENSCDTNSLEARQRHLPYLQAVIRESLRCLPPVSSGTFYKSVPPGGDTIVCAGRREHFLPGGTRVATAAAAFPISRSRQIWGEDAEAFRPERWIEAAAAAAAAAGPREREREREMVRAVELGFGSGQFVCPGRGLAMAQLNRVIPELVRRYNFSLMNPTTPIKLSSALSWIVHDFVVRVEKREAGPGAY